MSRFKISSLIIIAFMLVAIACSSASPSSQPQAPATPQSAPTTAPSQFGSAALTPRPPDTPVPVPAPNVTAPTAPTPRPDRDTSVQRLFTPTPTSIPVEFPVTITDSLGREIVFDEPPERIVAFDGAAVETLFAMGEGHRVVATHSFVNYPPEVEKIQRVGGAFDMNIEATVALEPDLVFIFFDRFLADLENAGLKVLYIQTLNNDFEKVADNIRLWGQIVGNATAAERVASDFEARIADIRATMTRFDGGMVVMQDEGSLWAPGPDTLVGEVFDMLKLQNIAHDVSGYAQLSPEVIVQRNPQLIITFDPNTFLDNPAFANLHAVKNNQVFMSSGKLSVAGPRFVEGIEELATLAYPGLFRASERP